MTTTPALRVATAEIIPSRPQGVDARAWAFWLLALVTVALMTRNPLYQLLLASWVLLTWRGRVWPLISIGSTIIGIGAIFNGLTVHIGATHLATIPGAVPLISGAITAEALAFGAMNGLTIALLILIFSRFSQAIDYASLLRQLPAALLEMGLMLSISLTLIPNMRRAWQDIQHAQALRGHRVRGVRDLPPLLVPLVVNSLERALNLAEAMEARGYARRGTPDPRSRWLLPSSLVGSLVLIVLYTFMPMPRLLFLAGLLLCLLALWLGLSRSGVERTRLRRGQWGWRESLMTGAAVLLLAIFMSSSPQALNYQPYPALLLPTFNPWLGLATLGAMVPALLDS